MIREPGEQHPGVSRNLLTATGPAGDLVAAAHLAATAIEHGATIDSRDYGFKRFPGVEHVRAGFPEDAAGLRSNGSRQTAGCRLIVRGGLPDPRMGGGCGWPFGRAP